MSRFPSLRFLVVVLAALNASAVLAQKPSLKPQTKPSLGAVQMPGDKGKVGTIYQLGAKGSELYFTLESAALETIHPSPETVLVAGAKERL